MTPINNQCDESLHEIRELKLKDLWSNEDDNNGWEMLSSEYL